MCRQYRRKLLERAKGIEPSYAAWEAAYERARPGSVKGADGSKAARSRTSLFLDILSRLRCARHTRASTSTVVLPATL